jgi:hypothetical protein
MSVVMIMSQDRIDQEHAMLNRLVVGLANDGNQVVRIVPPTPHDEPALHEHAVSLAKRITTPMPVSMLLRNTRRDELIHALEKIDITAIVAFGKDAEQVARDLSKVYDAPVLQEVVSMQQAKRAKKSSHVWRWLSATHSLEQTITRTVGSDRSALVPLGAVPSHVTESVPTNANRCVSVLDAASNYRNTEKILLALEKEQNVHVFLECTGKHQSKLTKQIQTLHMQDRVTCMRDMASLRTLVTQSDVVVVPSKTMPMRTLLLEVMLASIPVIATEIPGFDLLIDEETALIATDSWALPIERVLHDRATASKIAKNGATLVREKYASASQIAAFEAAFTLI